MTKCNCGAKHTSFPNQHHDWCDVIKQTNEVVLHNFARMQFKRMNERTINVYLKETNQLLGTVDYEYWRGRFRLGIFCEAPRMGDTRRAVLECLEFLLESIHDDRMIEWRPFTAKARHEYQEQQSKTNINPHTSEWDFD